MTRSNMYAKPRNSSFSTKIITFLKADNHFQILSVVTTVKEFLVCVSQTRENPIRLTQQAASRLSHRIVPI